MKNILKFLLLLPFLALAFACAKEDVVVDDTLEVNPNNISGTWMLVEMNGQALPKELFMRMEIVRRDKKFSFEENMTGSQTVVTKKSGRYDLTDDGIISLLYDSSMSQFGNTYKIVSLDANYMTWVCQDGSEEIFVFMRTVPAI